MVKLPDAQETQGLETAEPRVAELEEPIGEELGAAGERVLTSELGREGAG